MFDLFPKAAIASNWEAQVSLGWDFEGELIVNAEHWEFNRVESIWDDFHNMITLVYVELNRTLYRYWGHVKERASLGKTIP